MICYFVFFFPAGSAAPAFGQQEAIDVEGLVAEVQTAVRKSKDGYRAVRNWLEGHLAAMQTDLYFHAFKPDAPLIPSVNQKLTPGTSQNEDWAVNVVGIVRTQRGVGDESMVLVTHFKLLDVENKEGGRHKSKQVLSKSDAFALGLGMSVVRILSEAKWLARDVIWVVADAKFGADVAISHWLKEYHEPTEGAKEILEVFPNTRGALNEVIPGMLDEADKRLWEFQRGGMIIGAIVFEADQNWRAGGLGTFQIRSEGPNGQLPNMDLIALVEKSFSWQEHLNGELDKWEGLENFWLVQWLGSVVDFVSEDVLKRLNPTWKLEITGKKFCSQASALLKFMTNQASGVSNGAHGPFRNYQIDAVSVRAIATGPTAASRAAQNFSPDQDARLRTTYKLGRALESSFRCLNNLLEKLHHSFFFYLMSSSSHFIPISSYIVPFFLFLLPLLLQATSLCFPSDASEHIIPPSTVLKLHNSKIDSKFNAELDSISESKFDSNFDSKRDLKLSTESLPLLEGPWVKAIGAVGVVHLWGVVVAMAPPTVSCLANEVGKMLTLEPKICATLIWFGYGTLSLWIFLVLLKGWVVEKDEAEKTGVHMKKSIDEEKEKELVDLGTMKNSGLNWEMEKVVMLGVLGVALGALSCFSFSLALISEILLVPIIFVVRPISTVEIFSIKSRKLLVSSDIFLSVVVWGIIPSFLGISVWLFIWKSEYLGSFWKLVEMHYFLGTALYRHLTIVVLPCFVNFMRLLVHSQIRQK